jgi:hypothetical protein
MTKKELIEILNDCPDDINIALRAKDDYLLTIDRIYREVPYFGNCKDGRDWEDKNLPKDKYGDIDYDNMPKFLIFDTFKG